MGVFSFGLLLGWLLSLAYPQGITNFETPRFWAIQNNFFWFAPNPGDWWIPPGYGLILKACLASSNPSSAIYWLNTLLFCLNSGLVYVLARSLFTSTKLALVLALSAVIFEFACMRIFFLHLFIMADPLYAELGYLGVLLSLIGWLKCRPAILVAGYLILGLESFIKPVGISLLPFWIGFAVFVARDWQRQGLKNYGAILISVLLLTGPLVLWSSRNYCIYGYAKNGGGAGTSLLKVTLPLLSGKDQVFSDPSTNSEFIRTVRSTEEFYWPKKNNWTDIEWFWHEQYFFRSEPVLGPFDYLAGLRTLNWDERMAIHHDSAKMFAIDQQSAQVASKIIRAHPKGYLKRVAKEYHLLFNPLQLPISPFERYQADPNIVYKIYASNLPQANAAIYPGRGSPDTSSKNKDLAATIGTLCNNPSLQWFFHCYYANQFWLSHVICLTAVLFLSFAQFYRGKRADFDQARRTSVVLTSLFTTAASYYLLLALVEKAMPRLAIGGGDLELHLMFLIFIFAFGELVTPLVLPVIQKRGAVPTV